MLKGRLCISCGKAHNTVIENTENGDIIEEIDKCIDCLMSKCSFKFDNTQTVLNAEEK